MTSGPISIQLTSKLAAEVAKPGVEAWAVYFLPIAVGANPKGTPVWTQLTGTSPIALNNPSGESDFPNALPGAKAYFIIQDRGTDNHIASVHTAVTSQGQIDYTGNPATDAPALNYRYDSFEFTFTPSDQDGGNLTNVNGFGIPMQLNVGYGTTSTTITSSATRGYNLSGGSIAGHGGAGSTTGIWGALVNSGGAIVSYFNSNDATHTYSLAGQPRGIPSPTEAVGAAAGTVTGTYSRTDWDNYINSLVTSGAMTDGSASQIRIAGYFNGAATVNSSVVATGVNIWHNGGFYSYRATWDNANSTVVLKADSNSQIQGDINIPLADLDNSIYSTLGHATVNGITGSLTPNSMQTGDNNGWAGGVIRDFVTGFTAGYYGRIGSSFNASTSNVDLNKEWNWDPSYAFQSHTVGATTPMPTSAAALSTIRYDPYAKIFFDNTDSYGAGYSDNLAKALTVGPLVNISDGTGSGEDSKKIVVTLYADDDDMSAAGYEQPQIHNYIAGAYATPVWTGDSTNISFNLNEGAMTLATDTPITLRLMSAGGHTDLPTVYVTTSNYFTVVSAGGSYTLNPSGAPPPGALQYTGLPLAAGVNWYQVDVGTGATLKTFNIYMSAALNAATGKVEFLNPGYYDSTIDPTTHVASGYVHAGAWAIDGLGSITPPSFPTSEFVSAPTVDFFGYGGATSLDPSLLVPANIQALSAYGQTDAGFSFNSNTPAFLQPYAPVVGIVNGGTFTEQYVPEYFTPTKPNPNPLPTPTTTPTIAAKDLNFGWHGADNAKVLDGTVSASTYTNKINGNNFARITVAGAGAPTLANHHAIVASADPDGQWSTRQALHFTGGNATYSVLMNEYARSDQELKTAITKASAVQSFTIAATADPYKTTAQTVANGVTINGMIMSDGAAITIDLGGIADAVTLSAGSIAHVAGSATRMVLSSGSHVFVSNGASTSGAVLLSAGEHIEAGGTAVNTDLSTHAHSFVALGGTVSGMYISGSGSGWISGTAVSTTLAGGWQTISAGGVASNTLLLQGGYEYLSGGTTSGSTVSNGGAEYVDANGIARGTVVSANGRLIVSAGGTASGAILAAHGYAYVSAGGTISGAVVSGSGSAWVSGTAVSTTLAGGHQTIHAGGVASGTQLQSGGYEHIDSSGTASGVVVSAAAIEYVSSGGTLSGATLSGGAIVVSSGGIVNGTIGFAGGATGSGNLILSKSVAFTAGISGLANAAQIVFLRDIAWNGGLVVSHYAGNVLTLGDGTNTATLNIVGAYTAANFHVASAWDGGGGTELFDPPVEGVPADGGGSFSVQAGDTVSGATIGEAALSFVLGTALATTVSGGLQVVSSGGVTSGTQVQADGSEYVSAGGSASEAVVWSNGTEVVDSGGLLNGATLSGGTLTVFTGGLTAGTITFAGDGLLKLFDADTFSGTVAGLAGDHATIDLMDVSFADASLTWSAGADGGILTITDGADTATLNLIGQYAASDFQLSRDTGGGTLVHAPPSTGDAPALLVGSHHG